MQVNTECNYRRMYAADYYRDQKKMAKNSNKRRIKQLRNWLDNEINFKNQRKMNASGTEVLGLQISKTYLERNN